MGMGTFPQVLVGLLTPPFSSSLPRPGQKHYNIPVCMGMGIVPQVLGNPLTPQD